MRKHRATLSAWARLGSPVLVVAALAACGCNGGGGGSGNEADAASGGSPDGGQAFAARSSVMLPEIPHAECGNDVLPDGGLAATAVLLADVSTPSALCGDAGTGPAGTSFVVLQVATAEYVVMQGTGTLTQALSPGTYAIADETVDDEDLCMASGGQPAILQMFEVGDASAISATSTAMSGTITITSVDAHSIAGSFSAVMGDRFGRPPDGGAAPTLTGTFDAAVCP